MGKVYTKNRYTPVDRAIDEKMQVLKDFYIVDRNNEDDIRKELQAAIRNEPNSNYDIVLDRVAKRMIGEKLY